MPRAGTPDVPAAPGPVTPDVPAAPGPGTLGLRITTPGPSSA